eukprot:31165-Eustigmatos_ZCMA.PRE.1
MSRVGATIFQSWPVVRCPFVIRLSCSMQHHRVGPAVFGAVHTNSGPTVPTFGTSGVHTPSLTLSSTLAPSISNSIH